MASLRGTLHGALTEDGPRAWLGDQPRLTLWPQDIRIRFDPTELIGPEDEVLASEGEELRFAGGEVPLREGSPYGQPGERVVSIESPLRGVPRHPPHPRLAQPLDRDEFVEAWGEARWRENQYAESAEDSEGVLYLTSKRIIFETDQVQPFVRLHLNSFESAEVTPRRRGGQVQLVLIHNDAQRMSIWCNLELAQRVVTAIEPSTVP